MLRLAVLSALALSAGACATTSEQQAKKDVEAVVVDEKARAAAATVARRTGDSEEGVEAAGDVSTREPATPK
jgi:hypothetical protein